MSCVTIAFLLPGWKLIQIFNINLYQNTDYNDCKKLSLRLKHHKIETLAEILSYHDTEYKYCRVFESDVIYVGIKVLLFQMTLL
jgi:hypothetical protein